MKIDIIIRTNRESYIAECSSINDTRIMTGRYYAFTAAILALGNLISELEEIDILDAEHELTIKLIHE